VPETPRRVKPLPRNATRVVVLLVFGWSTAALVAVVAAGVIGFLEVQRACERGFGDTGASRAEVTFRSSIAVTCRTPDAGTFEVPMNGAAATVLFGGFGLVVVILLMIAYAAFRSRSSNDQGG
jgi:membrane protein required for beta-lactamase induction